jgi:hypothetical protein
MRKQRSAEAEIRDIAVIDQMRDGSPAKPMKVE